MSERGARPDDAFILDGLGAEVERCASCAAALRSEEVPGVEDDAAWARLGAEHRPGCEWIETRAHRRRARAA